ncbi:MAG: FKBP-type peptidyl-prolyl cis-trans isomerase [Candidatus Hydrogenedens sp.]|jgi:FKBP-type peptidyl-prolyl cis-trans isomerase FkpA/FKBP-type peptidyl-prolyl cis-trans isomerase FklB|nr:FKBP-type peptidyl-prolyl cis-trans isomerase [Candidatus Hydrogenedens sp.]
MKISRINILAGMAFFLITATGLLIVQSASFGAELNTEEDRISYAIGLQLGTMLKQSQLDVDIEPLSAGIADMLAGKEPALNEEQLQEVEAALQKKMQDAHAAAEQRMEEEAQENLAKAEEYLSEAEKQEGVRKTDSGLLYTVEREGDGDKPSADSRVRVHYAGTLIDGTEFDSSYKRGEPATFGVGQVIPGWTEALQMMKVGAKYNLIIPPDLAYGPQGNQRIPGNSVLLFEVELLEILSDAPQIQIQ